MKKKAKPPGSPTTDAAVAAVRAEALVRLDAIKASIWPKPTRDFTKLAVVPASGSKIAVGLDLGTRCGIAIGVVGKVGPGGEPSSVYLGQLNLASGDYESGAIRFVRLRQALETVRPDVVFYEEPKATPPFSPGTGVAALLSRVMPAAEFLGGLKTTLCTWCEEAGVPCFSYSIGAIKKFAAASGAASKEAMIAACNQRLGLDLSVDDYKTQGTDNMADAAFVLLLGLAEYGAGVAARRS